MEIFLVVCRNGVVYRGFFDCFEMLYVKFVCKMFLLYEVNCLYYFGEGKCDLGVCRIDWFLRMLKFFLVECEVGKLSFFVIIFVVY